MKLSKSVLFRSFYSAFIVANSGLIVPNLVYAQSADQSGIRPNPAPTTNTINSLVGTTTFKQNALPVQQTDTSILIKQPLQPIPSSIKPISSSPAPDPAPRPSPTPTPSPSAAVVRIAPTPTLIKPTTMINLNSVPSPQPSPSPSSTARTGTSTRPISTIPGAAIQDIRNKISISPEILRSLGKPSDSSAKDFIPRMNQESNSASESPPQALVIKTSTGSLDNQLCKQKYEVRISSLRNSYRRCMTPNYPDGGPLAETNLKLKSYQDAAKSGDDESNRALNDRIIAHCQQVTHRSDYNNCMKSLVQEQRKFCHERIHSDLESIEKSMAACDKSTDCQKLDADIDALMRRKATLGCGSI